MIWLVWPHWVQGGGRGAGSGTSRRAQRTLIFLTLEASLESIKTTFFTGEFRDQYCTLSQVDSFLKPIFIKLFEIKQCSFVEVGDSRMK